MLIGNSIKVQNELGWENEVEFKDLVRMLAEADLKKYYKKKN